jgi:hypothetical protein
MLDCTLLGTLWLPRLPLLGMESSPHLEALPSTKAQEEYFIIHPTMVDLSHVSMDALFQMVNSNSLTAPPSPPTSFV